jgi:chromosome segregation ATPase
MRAFMNYNNWQDEMVKHGHTKNSLKLTKQELEEAREYIADLEQTRDELTARAEELTTTYEENKTILDAVQAKNVELDADLDKAKRDIEAKDAKYKSLFEENEALVDKYARVRDERKDLKVELQAYKDNGGVLPGPETSNTRCQTDLGMDFFDREAKHGESSTALGTNQAHGASANDLDIGGLVHDQSI